MTVRRVYDEDATEHEHEHEHEHDHEHDHEQEEVEKNEEVQAPIPEGRMRLQAGPVDYELHQIRQLECPSEVEDSNAAQSENLVDTAMAEAPPSPRSMIASALAAARANNEAQADDSASVASTTGGAGEGAEVGSSTVPRSSIAQSHSATGAIDDPIQVDDSSSVASTTSGAGEDAEEDSEGEEPASNYRNLAVCHSCPYQYFVDHRMSSRTYMKSRTPREMDYFLDEKEVHKHTDIRDYNCHLEGCGSEKAYYRETSASVKGEIVVHLECTKCSYEWREN